MYYRASRNRRLINARMQQWLNGSSISPEMGKGLCAAGINSSSCNGGDLIRGFDNYTSFKEAADKNPMIKSHACGNNKKMPSENPEAPISDGRGGYVPSAGAQFPPNGERSRLDPMIYDGIYSREVRLMHELYGGINAFLYPLVVETINALERSGSDIYDYALPAREGKDSGTLRDAEINREALAHIVDEVYKKAVRDFDDFDEICCDDNLLTAGYTREALLKGIIEALVLAELFLIRRPYYRDTVEIYRFFDGRYDGMNPTY